MSVVGWHYISFTLHLAEYAPHCKTPHTEAIYISQLDLYFVPHANLSYDELFSANRRRWSLIWSSCNIHVM